MVESRAKKSGRKITYFIPKPDELRVTLIDQALDKELQKFPENFYSRLSEEEFEVFMARLRVKVERIVSVKEKSFYTKEELCEWYYDIVFKQVLKKTKSVEDAEDLTQEIFMFFVRWHDDINHKQLSVCLSKMASNAHMNWLRELDKTDGLDRKLDIMNTELESEEDRVKRIESRKRWIRDPELYDPYLETLFDNARYCMTMILLSHVSRKSAELFSLVYFDGEDPKDLANRINMKPHTLYTNLHRVREALGTCVADGSLRKEDFL